MKEGRTEAWRYELACHREGKQSVGDTWIGTFQGEWGGERATLGRGKERQVLDYKDGSRHAVSIFLSPT